MSTERRLPELTGPALTKAKDIMTRVKEKRIHENKERERNEAVKNLFTRGAALLVEHGKTEPDRPDTQLEGAIRRNYKIVSIPLEVPDTHLEIIGENLQFKNRSQTASEDAGYVVVNLVVEGIDGAAPDKTHLFGIDNDKEKKFIFIPTPGSDTTDEDIEQLIPEAEGFMDYAEAYYSGITSSHSSSATD